MFEKVNPNHPDKVADRIAGAIVDLAYAKGGKLEDSTNNPKVAVEVLIGHGKCDIIIESSVEFKYKEIEGIVKRITNIDKWDLRVTQVPQDKYLAENQEGKIRCGDNGIFKGEVPTDDEKELTKIAKTLYDRYESDGKYIIDNYKVIICQSNATEENIKENISVKGKKLIINPLGEWTGGTDVDTGATNRKLGSDMGRAVTGGGLHGKDLSKADVSINIYMHLMAQHYNKPTQCSCAIGDEYVQCRYGKNIYLNATPFKEMVEQARKYIVEIGGFEKLAEWGLIR